MQTYFAHHPVLHAVVDLSGYDGEAAFDLGNQLLSYRVGWLIYVSSDSVYEACAPKTHTGPTREEDAVRDEDLRAKLEAAEEGEDETLDVFGHNKLAAEEQFRELREETKEDPNGWGYVALRLPDVVGPRDTSYRWWFYQILIRVCVCRVVVFLVNTPLCVYVPSIHTDTYIYIIDIHMHIHVHASCILYFVFSQAHDFHPACAFSNMMFPLSPAPFHPFPTHSPCPPASLPFKRPNSCRSRCRCRCPSPSRTIRRGRAAGS